MMFAGKKLKMQTFSDETMSLTQLIMFGQE